ncbi:MAG: hypothetical protein J6K52_01810 [Clostridia bacterium]|nr:hypothetical protein [Clostridia bacterium]
MKKLLSSIIVVIMLFAMTVPVFATNIKLDVENLSETDIAYDFEYVFLNHYKLADYKATTKLEAPIIIAVTEQGYEQYFEKGDFDGYALYIYVYNPRMENITFSSENNLIQFSTNLYLSEGIQTKKPHISLVDTYGSTNETGESTNGLILKYRVEIPTSGISVGSKVEERYYYFSGIELVIDGASEATDFAVDQKHFFYEENGYLASRVEYPNTVLQLNTKDKHTYYRIQTDEYGLYKDLRSCWFNISNDMINKYGDLTALSAVWRECKLAPMLITTSKDVYDKFIPQVNTVYNAEYRDWFLYFNLYSHYQAAREYADAFAPKGHDYFDEDNHDGIVHHILAGVFLEKEPIESLEMVISSREMNEYLDGLNWNENLFESIDDTHYNLDNPELFQASTINALNKYEYLIPSLWDYTFNCFREDFEQDGEVTFSNLQTIDSIDIYNLSNEEFSKKYYVALEDVENIKADYKGDSTMFLFRYSATDYKTYENVYHVTGVNDILDECVGPDKVGTDGEGSFVVEMTAVTQFDILEVHLYDGYNLTIFAVVHSPVNTITGVTAPYIPPDPVNEFLQEIYTILMIIFCIIVILIIINIVLKIVNVFKKRKEKK